MKRTKQQPPELSQEAANAIIAQVFAACNQEPNKTPLEVLTSYSLYRRERYSLQKAILVFMLCVFLLLPACFVAPRFSVEEIAISETGIPTYQVRVHNRLPIRLVSAKIDDRPVPIYESDSAVYTVEPNKNGTLTITVTLFNRQYALWSTEIDTVDADPPVLVSSENRSGNIRIYYTDAGVGVDASTAYAIGSQQIAPSAYSTEEGWVEFPLTESMNVFISDRNGNTLQLLITLK